MTASTQNIRFAKDGFSAEKHSPNGDRLRVMMVSEFPFEGVVVGGVQSAVEILAKALSRHEGIEEVLVLSFNAALDRDVREQVNEKLTVYHAAGQRRFSLPTMSLLNYLKAKRVAAEFRPDIVHGQGTGEHGDLGIRLGYPSVLTIHGAGTFEVELRERNKKILGPCRIWMTTKMTHRAIRNAGVVISISRFDLDYSKTLRADGVMSIPNAVREEFFEHDPAFPEEPRIVFNGLIIERKNVAGLVRAFAQVKKRVPQAILDIAGLAPDKPYFELVQKNIAPEVSSSIIFHGNKKGDELPALMRNASVAVLFSIYENLPVAIAEAMALGMPIVATRVGGIAEMIENGGQGFLVESEDEHALAERLVTLLNDSVLRKKMGMKGYETARERWLPERVAAETFRAYQKALAPFCSGHHTH